ncbi:hypothetical protein ACSLM9_26040, partial [Escherichia coli]
MLEILRIWLETLGDNERDKQKSRIATALITLLEPVIMELQEMRGLLFRGKYHAWLTSSGNFLL